jgi:hypothetical protein
VEEGYQLSALDVSRDQQTRAEIYDAIQRVLDDYQLLVTPTLACLPVDNADHGNTVGPSRINDVEVDPLIGWCLTYFVELLRPPGRVHSGGLGRGPVAGWDAADRPPLCRRRRAGGKCHLRAAQALAGHLSALCGQATVMATHHPQEPRLKSNPISWQVNA